MPALPASGKWVECNGQVLVDALSPLDGQTIPNLNGVAGGADSPGQAAKVAMFLRGGVTSGTGQTDAFQGHWHELKGHTGGATFQTIQLTLDNATGTGTALKPVQEPISDGTNGTPRTASETRPVNMSVVWIMRVK